MASWNTTIDDTSPTIVYSPYSEGPLQNGWETWFSDSQTSWNSFTGEEAEGTSLHITELDGASLYMQFQGTAIYLYGTSNCTYDIELDSRPVEVPLSLPYGILYASEGLDSATHSVVLTAHPNQTLHGQEQLAFDQATFSSNGVSQGISGISEIKFQNDNTTALQYKGNWTTGSGVANIPSKADPGPFKQTQDPLASVSMNFTGGVAVAIHGSRNFGHWTYNVTLNGHTSSYNASTTWEIGDVVLFYQNGLDPSQTYAVEMVNTGLQDYYKMTLNYFSVFMPNNSNLGGSSNASSSSTPSLPSSTSTLHSQPTNVGVIVGPAIAGVAVLSVLALLLLRFFRQRTRRQTLSSPNSSMNEAGISPFPPHTRPQPWQKGLEAGAIAGLEPVRPTYGKRPAATPRTSERTAPAAETSARPSASVPAPALAAPPMPTTSPAPAPATASPMPAASSAPPGLSAPPVVDVDRLLEALAQRIDPRPRAGERLDHDDVAPPRYRKRG
ncbi:hypothetical protein PHLGIDRAFT_35126 [Phlebiopsis gigantea 11061_1 CR5-6]|uniref:Uncharacterized protein n=1 Tax=Phlebiopsis gigantea (strain 11061_1 CR5-6) TaxID=745531 RepID=A0A0C3SBL6_PHLG1|nr:hypothetical protein PHLGIDRAFT_35126 [Phlebiopsis gigantea 11061_1 CR5-6]